MDAKKLYERIILRTIIIVLGILFIKYLGGPLFNALFPVILALIIVGLISPIIKKIDDSLSLRHTIISYIVGTILLIIILIILIWLVQIVLNQLGGLVGNIISNWDQIVKSVSDFINNTNSKIEVLPPYISSAINSALNSLYDLLKSLEKNAVNITINFTSSLINRSNDFIFFIITSIVSFYIILGDMENASMKYQSSLPEYFKNNIGLIRSVFKNSTASYIKAQLKMALWCAILMALGLKILGQEYFLPIALLMGFLDLLPMIGPIIFMLPWSSLELFIFNNTFKGIGLLVLLIFWTSLRQVIAPKVIGSSADIHPLLSVIALYSGLKLFSIKGAIIAPIIMIFIVGILRSGLLDNWIYDYKDFISYISKTLGKRRDSPPTNKENK